MSPSRRVRITAAAVAIAVGGLLTAVGLSQVWGDGPSGLVAATFTNGSGDICDTETATVPPITYGDGGTVRVGTIPGATTTASSCVTPQTVTVTTGTSPPPPPPPPTPPPPTPPPPPPPASIYDPTSPWNTKIPAGTQKDTTSDAWLANVKAQGGGLTVDPTQCTISVNRVSSSTPLQTVNGDGSYSTYDAGDASRAGHGSPWSAQLPVPSGYKVEPSCDQQNVMWDTGAGIEYGCWLFSGASPPYTATNCYRYHTTAGYYGRMAGNPASGLTSGGGRGAGTPYLAGLIFPSEIADGTIPHALAWAYAQPSVGNRYPATKSDGSGSTGAPEGVRLQLDPTLTDSDIQSLGCTGTCLTIAKALREYGAYLIDHSGSTKLYAENTLTANNGAGWGSTLTRTTVASLTPSNDWSHFRIVPAPTCVANC